jgi:hypothetical protein
MEELDAIFEGAKNFSVLSRQVDELARAGEFEKAMTVAKSMHAIAEGLFGSNDEKGLPDVSSG